MARQYFIDGAIIQETGTYQYAIPGASVQETTSAAAPATSIDFFNPPLTGGTNSMQGNFQG